MARKPKQDIPTKTEVVNDETSVVEDINPNDKKVEVNTNITLKVRINEIVKKIVEKLTWNRILEISTISATFITFLATVVTAIGVFLAFSALNESNKQGKDNAISNIFSENYEPTKILIEYPDLLRYFDKKGREKEITKEMTIERLKKLKTLDNTDLVNLNLPIGFENFDTEQKNQELIKAEFENLPQELKNRIWMITLLNADIAEKTFIKRIELSDCDWIGWWDFYCDFYDESPIFRDFLKERGDWYEVDGAIVQAKRNYYRNRNDEGKQLDESKCIKNPETENQNSKNK